MRLCSNYRKPVVSLALVAIVASVLLAACSAAAPPPNNKATGSSAGSAGPVIRAEAKPQAPAMLGNAARDGAAVSIPPDSFDEAVVLTLKTLTAEETRAVSSPDFEILGAPVQVKVEKKEAVRLNQPAEITIAFKPPGGPVGSPDDIYAAYRNGSKWEYFLPDEVDLQKGIVKFHTYHFSVFGAVKLSEKEQIERFAAKMAVSTWAKKTKEAEFIQATSSYFDEAFSKLGIRDSQARGKLLRSLVKENDFGDLLVILESNDQAAFHTKVATMAGTAALNKLRADPDFLGNAASVTSTAARAAGLLAGGDYVGAQKEIASGMMDFFPAGRALKAAIETIDTGISDWKDNEVEAAYQAFKNGSTGGYGYSVTKGNWNELVGQMKGIMHRLYSDAIKAHAAKTGVHVDSLSKSTLEQIRRDTEAKLRTRFQKRIAAETEIDKEKANHSRIVAAFKRMKLLERGSFGFDTNRSVTIEDRLYRLYNVMANIQEIIGREIPLDDMCVLIGVWYNDRTPTKADFYGELRKRGLLKPARPAAAQTPAVASPAPAAQYAWVLKSVVDYTGAEAAALANKTNSSYTSAVTYSQGSFSIKTTFIGKSDPGTKPPKVNGEALAVRAQFSKPPQSIKKDETVTLTLSLGVTSNTQSFFTFSGSARAAFDAESIQPGSATRAAIDFVNEAKQYFFETKKGNSYKSFNEKISAKPRAGSRTGDKLALLVTLYSQGISMGTKYVYEWTEVK